MADTLTITGGKTSSLLNAVKTAKDNGSVLTAPTNGKTKEPIDAALTKDNQVPTLTINPIIVKPTIPIKPIIPSVRPTLPVIQQANMELSNGSMQQALNTLKSAEQEAAQPQGSTETKGEPSWPEEPEYDDYEDEETETTDDKPGNLKWWLIGGIGGALLITAIVVIIIVVKRKK